MNIENPLHTGLDIAKRPESVTIVIFGGSGDLARRKLVPALYNMFIRNLLPKEFHIVGVARQGVSDKNFRDRLLSGVSEFSRVKPVDKNMWEMFAKNISFFSSNSEEDKSRYSKLAAFLKKFNTGNKVFYLAIPPNHFSGVIERLAKSGLSLEYTDGGGFSRIVVEKPFGKDLKTAKALNEKFLEFFKESQVYRIDHYLGKETVQNILVFRFGNGIFEPLWNGNMIDHIQITMSESIGIGNRGEYFDNAGIIRDIVQNHIMQLVSLIGMEPPTSFNAKSIRDEKLKVIHSIRPLSVEEARKYSVRGQYEAGLINGEKVIAYKQEEKIKNTSKTETFLALKFFIDNWRFGGIPIYIRTGKRLPKRVTEIAIQFKKAPHTLFGKGNVFRLDANFLILRIQPDEGISLKFNSKVPGQEMRTLPVNMDFSYNSSFGTDSPDAYERLLLDSLIGDSTLFLRADELEASWSLINPILKSWEEYPELSPIYPYKAGSWGPKQATVFMEKDRRFWRRP